MDKKAIVKYCVLLPIVLLVTIFIWALPTSSFGIDGLTVMQQRTIAIFAFAALMWIFEIVPNWVTSLIVIVLSLLTISNKSVGNLITPKPYLTDSEIVTLDKARAVGENFANVADVVPAIDSAKAIVKGKRLGGVETGGLSSEQLTVLRRQYSTIVAAQKKEEMIAEGYRNLMRIDQLPAYTLEDSTSVLAAQDDFEAMVDEYAIEASQEDLTPPSKISMLEMHVGNASTLAAGAATLFNKDTDKPSSMSKELCYEQGKPVPFKTLMGAFADPVVMLFLGGFVLAIVASKYGMDITLARILLKPFGKNPKFVLLGVLVVIAIFSMFMSNTATAAMFLAFLAPVFASLPDADNRGKIGLALAIPVAANFGGIGTPIGTPPNATAVGILANNNISVTFGEWAVRMIPFVIVMILIAWVVLMLFFPFKSKEITLEIKENDRKKDWRSAVAWITFGLTILLWMTEQWTHLNANIVALIPLAVYTATGIFTSEDIKQINWNVLWLVAGGFALGYALNDTGLAKTLVTSIDFSAMNIIVVFVVAGLICYFLSNFISNSATAALLIPIMVAMGKGLLESDKADAFIAFGGQQGLAIFVAVCASVAMLLPISTPPNAIASSTGLVETKDMTKVGLIMGIIGLVLGFFWVTKLFPFA